MIIEINVIFSFIIFILVFHAGATYLGKNSLRATYHLGCIIFKNYRRALFVSMLSWIYMTFSIWIWFESHWPGSFPILYGIMMGVVSIPCEVRNMMKNLSTDIQQMNEL